MVNNSLLQKRLRPKLKLWTESAKAFKAKSLTKLNKKGKRFLNYFSDKPRMFCKLKMFVSTIQYFCIAFIISTANCADKRIAQVKYSELLK
ncbi:MAG: hypothetical protein DRR08_27870, partial [Candidatus Parabeggiatoa sp. nov. 2]